MNSDGSYSNRYSTTSAPSSGSQSNVTEMSGCSTIDIDIARMFWKSFSLSPPIESKLFSPDIKQRRRTATASGRSRKKQAELYKSEIHGNSQSQVYHYDDEEIKRKDLIYEKRIQTLNLQRNLRKIRLQKEEISSRVKPIKCENERYDDQESDSREEKEEVRKLNFFRSKSVM